MSQALTFTILAAVAGVVAVLPVVYVELRRAARRRQDDERRMPRLDALVAPGDDVDDPRFVELTTYPDEAEGLGSVAALRALSPCAIANLAALGYDEIEKIANGLPPGLPIASHDGPSFTEDELGANGYVSIDKGPIPDDNRNWAVLTDGGRRLARILTASSASPQWLWDASRRSTDQAP